MKSKRFKFILLLAASVVILSAGCKHMPPSPPVQAALEDVFTAPNSSTDMEMVCGGMPGYLDELDILMRKDKYNLPLIFRASGAHFGYAYSCLEDRDRQGARDAYLKGRDLSLAELRRYSYFDQAFEDSLYQFKKALAYNFDKRNIQPLYWTAMNWFGYTVLDLNAQGARQDLQKIAAMLEFVARYDAACGNGTVYAVLGSIRSILNEEEGGDVERAKHEFDKAAEYSGNSLYAVQVMKARWLAVRIKDKAMFEKILKEVISSPIDRYPDRAFVNLSAQRKARLLLEAEKTLFPEG
jgi:hypothetical protein